MIMIPVNTYMQYQFRVYMDIQATLKKKTIKKMLTSWANAGEFGELFPLSGGEPVDIGMGEIDALAERPPSV